MNSYTTQQAMDKVTIDIDYDRPVFIFPNLSSPQGNPMEYFKLAKQTLDKHGFRREAKELTSFNRTPYQKQFDIIFRFLDFKNTKVDSEDSEYIYIKIKKNSISTEQPRVFDRQLPHEITKLINDGHDFSLTNCFGRNHLYYLTELESIKILIEANKTNNWFELFTLDNFNSTILHGDRSLPVLAYLLDEMHKENKELTKLFLYGTNVFDNNAFGEFLLECDVIFAQKNKAMPSDKNINDLCMVLSVMSKIDPNKRDELIGAFDKLEKLNPQYKDSNIKALLFNSIMNICLPDTNIRIKKPKI